MIDETQYEEAADEEAMIVPRPRTMKKSPPTMTPPPPAPIAEQSNGHDEDDATLLIHGGWTAGKQVMDSTSQYAQALRLGEQIQIIKFLDDQPYANYRRHWVDRMTAKGPATIPFTCLESVGKDCPLCDIADRPQAVSAFNVVLIGDDGQVILRTWDVGVRLFNMIQAYANDPRVGPLSKGYFAVSQTGRKQQAVPVVTPIFRNRLEEDYDIVPPSDVAIERAGKYDASIIRIPKRSELDEIASEISEYE